MQAPTPFLFEKENIIDFKIKKEITSNKNNNFLLFFDAESYSELNIKAIRDDFVKTIYSNKFSVKDIQQNKYFYQFDDLKEICDELSDRISKENISIIEETNSIIISIPLPSTKIKDIIFELPENEKSDKEMIKELINLVHEQKEQITKLQTELNDFKNEMSFLLNNYISKLDSLIINNNYYNSLLKNWISPNSKVKANLLYRLSRDGPEIDTFHKLCDNKGPKTLVLFYLKNGHKIGFFVNGFFDSVSQWKNDNNSFLFNLNQNKIFNKINNGTEAFNSKLKCGPSANGLGCNSGVKLNYIYLTIKNIDKYFKKASTILPREETTFIPEIEYEVIETEIFQIIIE